MAVWSMSNIKFDYLLCYAGHHRLAGQIPHRGCTPGYSAQQRWTDFLMIFILCIAIQYLRMHAESNGLTPCHSLVEKVVFQYN